MMNKNQIFKSHCSCWKQITKNKIFEFQFFTSNQHWFTFNIGWTRLCDHPGLTISVGLLFKQITIQFYDRRHWSYEKQDWAETDRGRTANDLGV